MYDPIEMAERHQRMLSELAEIGLNMARLLQAQIQAAKDPKTALELSRAFERVSREISANRRMAAMLALRHRRRQRLARLRADAKARSEPTAASPGDRLLH